MVSSELTHTGWFQNIPGFAEYYPSYMTEIQDKFTLYMVYVCTSAPACVCVRVCVCDAFS